MILHKYCTNRSLSDGTNCITFSAKISFDNLTVMKLTLVSVVFVALILRANCDNDDEMGVKLEAMEKRLANMDAMEKRLANMDAMENQRLAKMDAMENRQQVMEKRLSKMDAMEKRLAKMVAMEKRLAKMDAMEKRLAKTDAMEKRQEVMEMREEVTNNRLAAVKQQQGERPLHTRVFNIRVECHFKPEFTFQA